MNVTIVGPGLVGSWLGAAAGAARAVPAPGSRPRARCALLPHGRRVVWEPDLIDEPDDDPQLVCTRVPDTPWERLGGDALLCQNGLGQPLPCIAAFFAVDLEADGTVRCHTSDPRVVVGDHGPGWEPVFRAWEAAGIAVERVEDLGGPRWDKLVLNATVGPLCLVTGWSMERVWAEPRLRGLVLDATAEGRDIGRTCGVGCADDLPERAAEFFAGCHGHRPSVLEDAGELPWILGYLRACYRRLGFSAPALEEICARVARIDPRLIAAPQRVQVAA